MSKDGRFYLRLTTEERAMLDDVAEAMGLSGNASAAVRFLVRERHRQRLAEKPAKPAPKKKR